jgi:subtilisin family serine protease
MRTKLILGLSVLTLFSVAQTQAVNETALTPELFWKGHIVVEVSPTVGDLRGETSPELAAVKGRWQVIRIDKLIPWSTAPEDLQIRDLSRFYIAEFPPEFDPLAVARDYASLPGVLSAEPYVLHKPCFTPNDTLFSQQWPLTLINAPTAWDFTLGSSAVKIGFVDTGTDTTHPDLRDNLWINPGEDLNQNGMIEPIEWNGADDDLNGMIDDFWGWNFAGNNNIVQDSAGHGTYCAGVATAVTNNSIGIAGLGCQAKIMTAKCGGSYLYNTTQAIAYLAANGADIISLSYGSYYYTVYEQAVINNAWGLGVIIVAAAGSDAAPTPHYPAAYDHVMAVGASDQNDLLAYYTNYGNWVDCYSPCGNISTVPGGGYQVWTGTSFCNPMAAGLSAMILAREPGLSNAQVVDHILATSVRIDSLNPIFPGPLRRLDAGAALAGLYLQTTLTPLNPPVIIPASGGSFNYDVAVTNTDSVARVTQFWCKVQLPNGTWYGPVVGPADLNLPPGSSIERTRVQMVPPTAPAGNYLFVGFLGQNPGSICSRDTLAFTKQGTRGGDEGFSLDGGDDGLRPKGPHGTQSFTNSETPGAFALLGNYPNPFNPTTAISYQLSAFSHVSLNIYDISGRLISELVDGMQEAGAHQATFDGSSISSGVYLYRLTADGEVATGKLLLLK